MKECISLHGISKRTQHVELAHILKCQVNTVAYGQQGCDQDGLLDNCRTHEALRYSDPPLQERLRRTHFAMVCKAPHLW